MIYEPKEDSYLLEKEVRKYAKGKKVLDMGTGSGIQAKAALEAGTLSVLAVDVDIGTVMKLKRKGINALKSNLFSKIKGKFDLIIFNPPYLPEDEREDKESALATCGGKRGDEIIIRFLKDARKYLVDKGIVLIVISSLTPKKRILGVLKKKGFKKKIIAKEKMFMEELEVWEIEKA